MKIILDAKDIKQLILEQYEEYNEIELEIKEDTEVILTINSAEFLKKKVKTGKMVPAPIPEEISIEKKNEVAVKQGTMASGGTERTVVNIG